MAWTDFQYERPFRRQIGQWRVATDIFYNGPVMGKYGVNFVVSLDMIDALGSCFMFYWGFVSVNLLILGRIYVHCDIDVNTQYQYLCNMGTFPTIIDHAAKITK